MRDFLAALGVCFHRWSPWAPYGHGWRIRSCEHCNRRDMREVRQQPGGEG